MSGQSLIHGGFAVVRLRQSVKTRSRFMSVHGQFGSLVVLPIERALELIEAGAARVPSAASRSDLRAAVREAREAAELAAA